MGKSNDIQALEESNAKFQAYLKQITQDLATKSENQVKMLKQEIDDYYTLNNWTSEKFIAGENVDFMHTSDWSLDRVNEIIKAISSAVFGGSPAPKGTDISVTPESGTALAAMANLELYLASRVFVALSGVLEAFGSSTSISFKTQYKSEALGNGFHLFTVMACDSYDSQGFFQKEKILEYLYSYEVRFSSGEANSHARIPLIEALTDSINVLAQKIKDAAKKWQKDTISDEQYVELVKKYKDLQDSLLEQLKDISDKNKLALRSIVAVPLIGVLEPSLPSNS
jgi:hypothetical protein